ncbi:transposable element Tcb2 transposase [Trichonephila clavipes]|nr:transposable element Tcb2 transposase [Trichonephila clavipes]
MKTVSVGKVKHCVSILSKDNFLRQGKEMRQHPHRGRFSKTGNDGQYEVWRQVGKELDPKNTIKTVKYGGGSVLVWGCMSAGGVGELVFIDDIMDKMVYSEILKNNLEKSVVNVGLGSNFIFQQDNDPKHTAKSVKLYSLYHCKKELHTPPQSPDLNVIENVWSQLEKSIHVHPITTKDDLKNVLKEEWTKVTVEITKKQVESMPKRLQAVIKAKGRDGSISSRGSGISKWCSNSRNKQIELEGEGHFARACLDIEVSIDRGNIGNEVSFNFSIETRLKVEVEDRLKTDEEAKAVEEWRKMEEERRMNERIALEGEMRLKKERLLVEEQMRHIQEECKMTMKEEQKCLLEKRCKRMNEQNQLLNEEQEKLSDEDMEVPQAIEKILVSKENKFRRIVRINMPIAQSVVDEKEKKKISVYVIKDKDDLNPVILSK